jgi:methylphosphotriester-DNA--protein-cysteine methyltransferase
MAFIYSDCPAQYESTSISPFAHSVKLFLMSYTTDATRWRALTVRDPAANGQFIYSVKSTNVYCRPTCPARLARRANIGFYKTPAQAEAAGFRACKRCKPQEDKVEDPQGQAVAKACTLIEEAIKRDDPKSFRLQELAKNVGLTPRYFHKIFKDKTGLTPKEYAQVARWNYAGGAPIAKEGQAPLDFFDRSESSIFNDLIDFDFDSNLPMRNIPSTQPLDQMSFAIGHDVDIDFQAIACRGLDDHDAPIPEIDASRSKESIQLTENAMPNFTPWQLHTPMSPAMSTFELDAALLLNAGAVQEVFTDSMLSFHDSFIVG